MPRRDRLDHLVRFYDLLDQIAIKTGGARTLLDSSACSGWPDRGVYFFFEPDEQRTHSGNGDRVVRVGAHAIRAVKRGNGTTLWNRLSQHKGNIADGGAITEGPSFGNMSALR